MFGIRGNSPVEATPYAGFVAVHVGSGLVRSQKAVSTEDSPKRSCLGHPFRGGLRSRSFVFVPWEGLLHLSLGLQALNLNPKLFYREKRVAGLRHPLKILLRK